MPPVQVAAPSPPATQARERAAAARSSAAAATTVPQLREQVAELARIVELLAGELERR